MKLKLFTMSYDAAVGGFDDEEMQAFQSSREVLGLQKHLLSQVQC